MSNATNLRGPDGKELVNRFVKRQPTGWTADALQGKRMTPPASPMQNMADSLRTPAAPAPVAPPATPKYTPPPVNPETGGYTANERVTQNVGGERPMADARPDSAGGGAGNRGAGPAAAPLGAEPAPTGLWGKTKGVVSSAYQGTSKVVRGAYSGAKAIGPGLAAGAAGNYAAQQARTLDDPSKSLRGNYTPPSAVSQIPTDGYNAAPTAQPHNWFTDTETGRNVGNTINAVAPLGGVVGSGLRSLYIGGKAVPRVAAMSDLVDAATIGASANIKAGRDEQTGSGSTKPSAPNLRDTYTHSPGDAPGDATGPGMDRELGDEFSNRSIQLRNPDGQVKKIGNSYSGGNVSGEVSFQGADGNALRGRPGGGYLSTDTSAGYASDKRLGDQMQADRLRLESEGYARQDQQAAAGLAAQDRYEAGLRERNARVKSTVGGLSGRARTAAEANATQLAVARMQSDTSLRTTGMNNDTSRQTTGMNNDTSLKTNESTNRTTMRGQDMDYEGKRLSSAATRAQLRYSMDKDARDFALTKETHDQTVGTKARENAMKEFRVFDPKDPSKVDEAASQQAFDAVRQIFPGIDSADESTRNKFMADAKEMHGIFQKARTQDKVGWDSAKFWQTKRPNLSSMPDAVGRKDEMVGQLAGLFTIGASGGDTLLQRPDGSSVNLGQLNERQRELLARAQKTGWGK